MEPCFKEGDYVLANKLFFSLKKGDVVVIRHPKNREKFLLKRINKVLGNKYIASGDNKKYSIDSRHFGPINKDLIVGKLIMHIRK